MNVIKSQKVLAELLSALFFCYQTKAKLPCHLNHSVIFIFHKKAIIAVSNIEPDK